MKCEDCGAEAFCTVVFSDGRETIFVHLCEKHAKVAGVAAMEAGGVILGVFKPEEAGDAARPETMPA